jgi:hypothetical protein
MEEKSKQGMNVARPHVFWRVVPSLGVLLFVSVFVASCLGLILPPEQPREDLTLYEAVLMIVCSLGFTCLSGWGFVVAWTVYRWNEEKIQASCFRRERTMRWDEVTSFRIRTMGGDFTYILRNAGGGRLAVDVHLLGINSPIHRVLRRKLGRFAREKLKKIDVSGEARFTAGPMGHRLILRRTSLVSKVPFRQTEMAFSKIATVYLGRKGGTVLVSRTGRRVGIPLTTQGYDTIIAYIRDRAANAVWVDMDQPEPSGAAEKTAYQQRVRELVGVERVLMWTGLFVTAILIAFLLFPCLALWPLLCSLRDMPGEHHWWVIALVCIYLIGVAFVYLLARAVQQTVRWRRSMRRFTDQSGSNAGQAQGADEDGSDQRGGS